MIRIAAGLLLLPPLALLAGALIPENIGWREPDTGIAIHLTATQAHTMLILPVAAAGHDWRAVFAPGDSRPVFAPGDSRPVGIGWGERRFYLETPTWADLTLATAAEALFQSQASLLHIHRPDRPWGARILLTPDQYRRLAAFIEASIAPGPAIPGTTVAGYGEGDSFLPAHGRYSLLNTCNQWTRDALAAAGVRVGRWTPLPLSLMWRFDEEEVGHG